MIFHMWLNYHSTPNPGNDPYAATATNRLSIARSGNESRVALAVDTRPRCLSDA